PSNSDDGYADAGSGDESIDVINVASHDLCAAAHRKNDDRCIHDVRRSGCAKKTTGGVSSWFIQWDDCAAAQKATKLNLPGRAACLCHHGGGHPWDNSALEERSVVCPYPAVVAIRRDKHRGVINDLAHAERRGRTR